MADEKEPLAHEEDSVAEDQQQEEVAETGAEEGEGDGDVEDVEPGDEDDGSDVDADGEEDGAAPRRQLDAEREPETAKDLRAAYRRLKDDIAELKKVRPQLQTPDEIRRLQEQQAQADAAELERARLEGPERFTEIVLAQNQRRNDARFHALQNQQFDRDDRAEFRDLCRDSPALARIQPDVEDSIRQMRAQGNYQATREAVAKYILGDRALKRAAGNGGKQRQRGAEQVRRQTVRTGQGGSDVSANRRRGGDDLAALERRLAKQII